MNPLVAEVVDKQLRSLRWIYALIVVCVLGLCGVTIAIGPPLGVVVHPSTLFWAELVLGILGLSLLVLVIPLSRHRLLDPERVRQADIQALQAWGLPETIEPSVGRQAVYLTRYTAGCVICWGLGASVGLYGLVSRMLGSSASVTGGFLAAAVFVTALLPPRGRWVRETLESL